MRKFLNRIDTTRLDSLARDYAIYGDRAAVAAALVDHFTDCRVTVADVISRHPDLAMFR